MRAKTALAVLFVVLAACTHSSSQLSGRPKNGGLLRVGVTPIGSLDPAQARSVDQQLVADQLFDALTRPDPVTYEPRPALADHWEASADQRQWDFFIRRGAIFSNGRPVTAADVKYTLERIAKTGSGSQGSDLLAPITGFAAFSTQGTAADLAGVTAPSESTVHISLDQPLSVLPSVLGSPVFGVVARESVEALAPAPTLADAPVTSGPFAVKSRTADAITLVAAPDRGAHLAGMQLVEKPDLAATYRAFRDGNLDYAGVPPEEVDGAARQYGRAAFRRYVAELFYGFNLKNPKLASPLFREAIVRGIDRRAIVKAVFGSVVVPVDGLVAEGAAGHQPDGCGDRCHHDLPKVKELLQQAFGANPVPEVQVTVDDDTSQQAVANAIKASLASAGIPATVAVKPIKDYRDFALSGQAEIFRLGWIARFPSADDFLPPLFATGSPNNLTGFTVPAVDDLLRRARAEADPQKRNSLYAQAERAIMDQVPVMPIAQYELHSVVAPRVRGLQLTSMGTFDGTAIWLTDAKAPSKR
jgi:ABC-type transport system substrate-binding protein